MKDYFLKLANQLCKQAGLKQVRSVEPISMDSDEQGYSGSRLIRLKCTFIDGMTGSFVYKSASLCERKIMQVLTDQKRGYSPYSYSDLNQTDENSWLIMQDIRSGERIPYNHDLWKKQVASALADIHVDNFVNTNKIPQIPYADEAYWKWITTQISVDHFERKCVQDNLFARQYGRELPKLRKQAQRFVRNMTQLARDGTSLTVTHGDLQKMDGDHVRCFKGQPVIIDWGFGRYAPFYIDLVDYFTQEEAMVYLKELHNQGIIVSQSMFKEGYAMTRCYPVFIYMYPALEQYNRGDDTRLNALLSRL